MPPSPRYVTIVPEYLKMKTFHQNSSFHQSNNLPTLARIWTLSFQVIPRLDGCVTSSSWSDRITEFVEKKQTLKRWQTQPVFFPLSWFSHFSPSICSLGKKARCERPRVCVRACGLWLSDKRDTQAVTDSSISLSDRQPSRRRGHTHIILPVFVWGLG